MRRREEWLRWCAFQRDTEQSRTSSCPSYSGAHRLSHVCSMFTLNSESWNCPLSDIQCWVTEEHLTGDCFLYSSTTGPTSNPHSGQKTTTSLFRFTCGTTGLWANHPYAQVGCWSIWRDVHLVFWRTAQEPVCIGLKCSTVSQTWGAAQCTLQTPHSMRAKSGKSPHR